MIPREKISAFGLPFLLKIFTRFAAVACVVGLVLISASARFRADGFIVAWGLVVAYLSFVGSDTENFYRHPGQYVLVEHRVSLAGFLLMSAGFVAYGSLSEVLPEPWHTIIYAGGIVVGGILNWIDYWGTGQA